jgi:hypothetical protein
MSIALQWGYYFSETNPPLTQGFLYFDAVTALRKSLTGSVSKNPIDGGGNIADHFTRDNPIVTFSGVISGVDISSKYKNIQDPNGNTPTNLKPAVNAVKINSSSNPLLDLLPASVGQFFRPSSPAIVMAVQSGDTLKTIQQQLESLFLDGTIQLVTLYEYYGNNLKREPVENLVMTSLVFSDTPETGNSLQCEITLEQVTFSQAKKTQIPKNIGDALVSQDLQNKAAGTDDKGKQDSTAQDGTPSPFQRDPSGSMLYRGVTFSQ